MREARHMLGRMLQKPEDFMEQVNQTVTRIITTVTYGPMVADDKSYVGVAMKSLEGVAAAGGHLLLAIRPNSSYHCDRDAWSILGRYYTCM
jgi:uncharacterized protein involved in high-affinity Fe2+ transport